MGAGATVIAHLFQVRSGPYRFCTIRQFVAAAARTEPKLSAWRAAEMAHVKRDIQAARLIDGYLRQRPALMLPHGSIHPGSEQSLDATGVLGSGESAYNPHVILR